MSHYEAPIREPLILGHKSYHDITEDIAKPIEGKAFPSIGLAISSVISW